MPTPHLARIPATAHATHSHTHTTARIEMKKLEIKLNSLSLLLRCRRRIHTLNGTRWADVCLRVHPCPRVPAQCGFALNAATDSGSGAAGQGKLVVRCDGMRSPSLKTE